MKRLYEFITKANQVLLFVVIVGGIALGLLLPAMQNVRTLKPRQVSVVDVAAEPAATQVRDVRFLGMSRQLFVFGIVKREVALKTQSARQSKMELYSSSSRDDERGSIVNVVYSRGEQVVRTLLPADGLVVDQRLPRIYDQDKFTADVFTCVTTDTDANHKLNENDRQDLIIVDPEMKKPDITVQNCAEFDIVSPTRLIAKIRTADSLSFVEVDVSSGKRTAVAWK